MFNFVREITQLNKAKDYTFTLLAKNRLGILNNEIDYNWLNLSFECFKIKCKGLFLTRSYRHKYIES